MVSENGFDLLKQMPQNIDAEQALLSAILLNNHALERVSEFLTNPINNLIFEFRK